MSTMSSMEQPNASQPAPTDPRPTQTNTDTDERSELHFGSLMLPELFSVPSFIAWLRKPFQRGAKT
jgi:hypothetical protein